MINMINGIHQLLLQVVMDASGQPVSQGQPMQTVQVQYVDPNQPQQVVQQVQILMPNPHSILRAHLHLATATSLRHRSQI